MPPRTILQARWLESLVARHTERIDVPVERADACGQSRCSCRAGTSCIVRRRSPFLLARLLNFFHDRVPFWVFGERALRAQQTVAGFAIWRRHAAHGDLDR